MARPWGEPLSSLEVADVSTDEVNAELDRICSSPSFNRSERSQQFLRYVCELTLRGEASRINQYLIGAEVFQRGADYSTSEDSVVRRQAHVLRQKLIAYYAREGSDSPIRIELPVGQYVPVFHRAAPAEEVPAAAPEQAARPWPSVRPSMLPWLLAVLLGVIGWLVGRSTVETSAPLSPAISEIWGPWLDDPSGLVIGISNPMTAMVKYQEAPVTQDLAAVRLAPTEAEEAAFRSTFNLSPGGYVYVVPSRANTKVGDALAAAMLATFFTKASLPVRATQSRLISGEDLRTQNFVLLGHNQANAWIDPLLLNRPFRLGESDGPGTRYIENAEPSEGEQSLYEVEEPNAEDESTREYALISMIPGLDSRRKLLLLSGLNTQATLMATELLTTPVAAEKLLARLKAAAPSHEGPWHFQAIIRTDVRDKVAISEPEIIAVRVFD